MFTWRRFSPDLVRIPKNETLWQVTKQYLQTYRYIVQSYTGSSSSTNDTADLYSDDRLMLKQCRASYSWSNNLIALLFIINIVIINKLVYVTGNEIMFS